MKEKNQKQDGKWRFHFTKYLKPMFYILLFSAVYMLGYLGLTAIPVSGMASYLIDCLRIIWIAVYGVGLYFTSTLVWGKKRKTLSGTCVSRVFLWNLAWTFVSLTVSSISRISMAFYVISSILSAFLLIFLMPATILFWYGVYRQEQDVKGILESIRESLKKHPAKILNPWLILFFAMVGWDSLFQAPLSIAWQISAPALLANLLSISAPFSFPILLLSIIGTSMPQEYVAVIMLDVLFSLVLCFLMVNLASWTAEQYEAASEKPDNAKKAAGGQRNQHGNKRG